MSSMVVQDKTYHLELKERLYLAGRFRGGRREGNNQSESISEKLLNSLSEI